jgi:hypothetical protein
MITVSQNYKLYFNLNKDIACEKLCQDISVLIDKFRRENNSPDCTMTFEIKPISYENTDIVPKIEYKN